jgi:hypothetical protein
MPHQLICILLDGIAKVGSVSSEPVVSFDKIDRTLTVKARMA